MILLIGLVSDKWQGDRLNMLPSHGFTREDIQNLSSQLLRFEITNNGRHKEGIAPEFTGRTMPQSAPLTAERNRELPIIERTDCWHCRIEGNSKLNLFHPSNTHEQAYTSP